MAAPVVDFHIHCLPYDEYAPQAWAWVEQQQGEKLEALVARYGSTAGLEQMLVEAGVDYAVVVAELCPVTTGVCRNETVARICRGSSRLIPFASLDPHVLAEPARELRRLVREEGFRGLKLYPTYQLFYPNEALIYPIYAAAEELGIPVMVHTGSSVFRGSRLKYGDPLYLDDVAVDFPDLKLIVVHGGRGLWYDKAFFLARLHPNVYLEVAGLPPQRLLTYFPELERVADKVLFGSDWPTVRSVKANIEAVRRLPLAEEVKEKILGGNAARLLGL
ncbi:MAG: amidohydrolase [Clostridia bacterium]|nr:amidohydrolase [Clostridia bacterium]